MEDCIRLTLVPARSDCAASKPSASVPVEAPSAPTSCNDIGEVQLATAVVTSSLTVDPPGGNAQEKHIAPGNLNTWMKRQQSRITHYSHVRGSWVSCQNHTKILQLQNAMQRRYQFSLRFCSKARPLLQHAASSTDEQHKIFAVLHLN